MEAADKDRVAYSLAKDYLLGFEAFGVTAELLEEYLNPSQPEQRHASLEQVFRRLVASAQNARMRARVVGGSIGGIGALHEVLLGFDPHEVHRRYGDAWARLLDDIEAKVGPRGEVRRTPRSIWPQFCGSVLSGAEFLSRFESGAEFADWVDVFDRDERTRPALPMLLAAEISGFGFPLACDFLKELGFLNFCKPDVHVKTVFKGLGLVPENAKDLQAFRAIIRVARSNGVTPYNADKLFWLVGSGFFYDHRDIGRIPTDRDKFIKDARRKLG